MPVRVPWASRDDVGQFMPTYRKLALYEVDPFDQIDVEGVGQLVRSRSSPLAALQRTRILSVHCRYRGSGLLPPLVE
jgi:hypothetical protein